MRTAVYRLYDAADQLLYVGIGDMPDMRYRDHSKKHEWWPDVARKAEVWHDTREGAQTEEADAIDTERPLHNKVKGCRKPIPEAPNLPTLSMQHTRTKIRDRIDAALERGEHTIITRVGRPVAVLVPYRWYEQQTEEK
jgi:prevent-host-death family protein